MQEPPLDAPLSSQMQAVTQRWSVVCGEIARAAQDCERQAINVTLVCVSKTYEPELIRPVLQAGQRVFGENRVQEAQNKWPQLRAEFAHIELHLIGPLQSNKVAQAVALFDVIESLDRPKLAEALAAQFAKTERRPKLYVQVNTGSEPQKAGVLPGDVEAFVADCRIRLGLDITGLMCIPPVNQQASPHFAFLAQMVKKLGLRDLSMGMSADFPLAIQLGATHVRVGSAIFGSRPPAN